MFMVNVGKYTSPMGPMGVATGLYDDCCLYVFGQFITTFPAGWSPQMVVKSKGIHTNMALNQVNDLW